jgi:hypothetical protein
MTASTNATRVFWGTAWTSQTLLARQARSAQAEQQRDGIQRLFYFTGDDVARIVPGYAAHLERVVRERGRQHPLVRTQYFNEEIDAAGGMFHEGRMALMFSSQRSAVSDQPNNRSVYAFCIDVAGMDESSASLASRIDRRDGPASDRDATTLSVIEIDLSTLETLQAPTYRVVQRAAWTGLNHLDVFARLKALSETWRPQHIVVDATGVGEGLWAMLDRAFPRRVIPVKFTQHEKSEIGWRFLSIIETGRFRAVSDQELSPQRARSDTNGELEIVNRKSEIENQVHLQYSLCQSEILPGPNKLLRWGVPDGTRGPHGERVHDDFVLADALVAKLDELQWSVRFEPFVIPAKDPLEEMSRTKDSWYTDYAK